MTTIIDNEAMDAFDEMLTEMLLADNLDMVKVPVGSSLVYTGGSGRIWCTPDAQYLIELSGDGGGGGGGDDNPDPDDPDNPYDWPPKDEGCGGGNEPSCKKTINLIYGAGMARMERIHGFDDFIMQDGNVDKWPSGIDIFVDPSNLPIAALASGTLHPDVFVDEEVMIPGHRPEMPELTTTVTYWHAQAEDDDFTRIPMAGVNTTFVSRTKIQSDIAKEGSLNLLVTPPPNFKIYRLSNGDAVGQFDKAWSGEITLELRNAAPPTAVGTSNKNFDYTAAFLSEATPRGVLVKKWKGVDSIYANTETLKGKEDTDSAPQRTLIGKLPTMDDKCHEAAEKILYQVLFANALKAKDFLQNNDQTFGGLTDARLIVLMNAQFNMFQQFLLDNTFSATSASDLIATMKKDLKIGPFAKAFQQWCCQWSCRGAATGAIQSARDAAGACDHRARVGVLVFNLIGIPARKINNSCHSYLEYFSPGQGHWIDLDLNGCDPGGDKCPDPSPDVDPDTPQSLEEEEEKEPDEGDDSGDDDGDDSGDDSGDDDGDDSDSDDSDSNGDDDGDSGKSKFDWNDPAVVKAILMNEYKYSESDAQEAIEELMKSDMFR